MANTTFRNTVPPLKAMDNGDGTYSLAVVQIEVPGGGTDTVFNTVNPPLKAIDLGDGTYTIAVEWQ